MSDANAFMNAYIDHAIGMVHENVNVILQLRTQLKLANDLIIEKDGVIGSLTSQLESNKVNNDEISLIRDQARYWEDAHNAMVNKVSHLDTALNQIAQMKKEVQNRDAKILALEEKLNPTKKKINTKKVVTVEEAPKQKAPEDDF
jgi:hypothetical protein